MLKSIFYLVIRWSPNGYQNPEIAFSDRFDAEAYIKFFDDDEHTYTIEKIVYCDRKLPF